MFSRDVELQNMADCVKIFVALNTFPDGVKGMIKGVIRALNVQKTNIILILIGHWGINFTLNVYFIFFLKTGIVGLWISKLSLEI